MCWRKNVEAKSCASFYRKCKKTFIKESDTWNILLKKSEGSGVVWDLKKNKWSIYFQNVCTGEVIRKMCTMAFKWFEWFSICLFQLSICYKWLVKFSRPTLKIAFCTFGCVHNLFCVLFLTDKKFVFDNYYFATIKSPFFGFYHRSLLGFMSLRFSKIKLGFNIKSDCLI